MKKGLLFLFVALLAGIGAFYITRSNHPHAASHEVMLDSMPELNWLRADLKLTDTQFAKVSALHTAYRPVCAEMCSRIAASHHSLESLARKDRTLTPELAQAIRDHAHIQSECREKMLEHLYQTAALMDEQQAAHYLESVLPTALDSTPIAPAPTCDCP